MKYMKLGTRPDTFYTEAATRTVLSDVPTDLIIQINNTRYLLHKFPLLLKCGLLQRLCSSDSSTSSSSAAAATTAIFPILLADFPGGEAAFELCAKFCYNISITLSAHNFIPAFSAATYLLMTESVSQPNLLPKLQTFFFSFILPNWKDSIFTLASASQSSPPFSDPTIISPLIDSIVSKILVPPSQVTWSFTYSRELQSTPKDWWTEDIADLDLNHFRSIIFSIRSNKMFPPPLIGEALHVYTAKNFPDPNQTDTDWNSSGKYRRVLEAIASMLPAEVGAVSGGFLMRLLKIAILVEASTSVKAELVRRAGRQLDEASIRDLKFACKSRDEEIALIVAVVKSFLEGVRRRRREGREEADRIRKVAKVFDEYLGIVARDGELEVDKFAELAELVPLAEREEHDGLYRAIDTFLEEHPNMSKAERKRLCQLIDCKKLSSEVRSEAIANNRLPLRVLVQLLFVEQERAGRISGSGSHGIPPIPPQTTEQAQVSRKGREEEEEHHHRQREETVKDRWDEASRLGRKGEGSGSISTLRKVRGEAQVQKKKKLERRAE